VRSWTQPRCSTSGSFFRIAAGKDFALAQTTEGHVYSWGNGELGQLGHQENKNKKVPKKISALRELELPVDLGNVLDVRYSGGDGGGANVMAQNDLSRVRKRLRRDDYEGVG